VVKTRLFVSERTSVSALFSDKLYSYDIF